MKERSEMDIKERENIYKATRNNRNRSNNRIAKKDTNYIFMSVYFRFIVQRRGSNYPKVIKNNPLI